MTTAAGHQIVPREPAAAPALRAADEGVAEALESVLSDHTRRVYGVQWRIFTGWCDEVGLAALPAEPLTVARYLAARANDGASIAMTKAHEWARLESPCRDQGVRAALKGWGRDFRSPSTRPAPAPSNPGSPRSWGRNPRAGRRARPLRPGPGPRPVRRRGSGVPRRPR